MVSETRVDAPAAPSELWMFDFLGMHLGCTNKKPGDDLTLLTKCSKKNPAVFPANIYCITAYLHRQVDVL